MVIKVRILAKAPYGSVAQLDRAVDFNQQDESSNLSGPSFFVLFHFCTVGGEVTQSSAKAFRLVRFQHCAPICSAMNLVNYNSFLFFDTFEVVLILKTTNLGL